MRLTGKWSILALAAAFVVGMAAVAVRADDAPAPAPATTGTVSGTVVDSNGKGVAGASVTVLPPPVKKNAQADGGPAPQHPKPVVPAVTTGDDGTYTISDVPAGKYIIVAGLKGVGRGHSEPIDVTAGQTTKVDNITLKPHQHGGGGGGNAPAPGGNN